MRIGGGRASRVALGAIGGIVVALGVAQLVLPGIAAQRVRDRVGKYGTVRSSEVTAFPAIELLWGKADSGTVRAGRLRMGLSQAVDLLWSARRVDRLNVTAEHLQLGPLGMRGASIEKHGDSVRVYGDVAQSDLRAALPGGVEVRPIASRDGEVEVQASGTLFGVSTSVRALVGAQAGKLVVRTQGFPLAALGRITLFSDPRLLVQGVDLKPLAADPSGQGGYRLSAWARLR
jgi:hypothetical protein